MATLINSRDDENDYYHPELLLRRMMMVTTEEAAPTGVAAAQADASTTATNFLEPLEEEVNDHLFTIKIILAVGIFLIGLVSVLAPQRLVASEGAQHWFSLGNMAASGVLLAAGMVHMLPDSAEVLNTGDNNNNFPVANFVAGLTFIAFMVMEEILHVVFMTKDCSSAHGQEEGGGGCCGSSGGGGNGAGISLNEVLMAGHSHDHKAHGVQQQQQHNQHQHKEAVEEEGGHHDHNHSHHHHHPKEEGDDNHSHSHSHDHHHHQEEADEKQPLLLHHKNTTTSSSLSSNLSTTSTTSSMPTKPHENFGAMAQQDEMILPPPPPPPCHSSNNSNNNSFSPIRSLSRRPKPSCCGGCVGQPHTYAPSSSNCSTSNTSSTPVDVSEEDELQQGGGGGGDNHSHNHSHSHSHEHNHNHSHQHDYYQRRDSSRVSISQRLSTTIGLSDLPEHHHHHEDHLELHLHGSIVATLVLMLALSIHAILAGVSIGIENSPEELVGTALAILAHKSFEGFCLGSSLVSSNLKGISFWGLAMGWTIATPLGIGFGQGILALARRRQREEEEEKGAAGGSYDPDSHHSVALVKAIVAGTFLYVAIVEIGSKELLACRQDDQQHGSKMQKYVDIGKLICFVFGYVAMSILALWS